MKNYYSKIDNLKIHYNEKNLCVYNSYNITSKKEMKTFLVRALIVASDIYTTKRKMNSLIREWVAHNRLYKLGLFKNHTADCDFEKVQKIFFKILYLLIGF